MNLIGRCNLDFNAENPFTTADRILKSGDKPTFTLVDFHAQATSEKLALSYYLDGRVSALWGTHTHVPTADGRVCPKGMGYLTDLGMTGPAESVLGVRPEQSVEFFLGGLPGRYRMADGPCRLQGALFTSVSYTHLSRKNKKERSFPSEYQPICLQQWTKNLPHLISAGMNLSTSVFSLR